MSKRLFTFLLVGAFVVAGLAPAANAACLAVTASKVAVKAAPLVGDPGTAASANLIAPSSPFNPTLNREGKTERVADVVVYDDGLGVNCFSANQSIRLTYNTTITVPNLSATPLSSATSANFDVYDSAGAAGLVITAASQVGLAPGGTPQTVITVTVLQAGTVGNPVTGGAGAAFRIKNLRGDATTLTTAPNTATVTVSNTIPGALVNVDGAVPPAVVGTSALTIGAGAAVTTPGSGIQSAGGPLTGQATFAFSENFNGAFRVAALAGATVLNDIASNPTSLILDAGTSVPSGVTVTFPGTMVVSNGAAAGGNVKFTLSSGGTCSGPSACFAIYQTSENDTTGPFTLTVDTASAASAGTYTAGPPIVITNPKIGVQIASPSGSGIVTLRASFGPAEAAGTGNDDVNATAVPRYLANNGSTGLTRRIFNSTNWFTITPVRTTLLFPFASTFGGFNTGLSIANTGSDSTVFAPDTTTPGQTGGITFYFFPTGGTAFSINTDLTAGGTNVSSACRGLNANGQLAPGGVMACALKTLIALSPAAPATFDGYVIAVGQFQRGHGFSAQFNGSGAPFAANSALVMGDAHRIGPTTEGLFE